MTKQFQRSFTNDDGTTEIWKYDLDKFSKGPIETITDYPKGWQSPLDIIKGKNKKLPLKSKFFIFEYAAELLMTPLNSYSPFSS